MVNIREKIYFIISISDKRISYFFLYPFPYLTFFVLICRIWVERAYSFLPTYLGGTFSPLLDISERNFFPQVGGGGGCMCTPTAYAPEYLLSWLLVNGTQRTPLAILNTSDSTILRPSFESVKNHLAFWNWARVILTSPLPIYERTKALCLTTISLLIVIALDRMDIYSRFWLACFCLVFGQTMVLTNQKRIYISLRLNGIWNKISCTNTQTV